MKTFYIVLSFTCISIISNAQKRYLPSYNQLKKYEGVYEYENKTTLKIAASPKDTILYAIINESKYYFTPVKVDYFLNMTGDTVQFLRDKKNKIMGYSVHRDTFHLLSKKVKFPKEMWYPRWSDSKDKSYQYQQPKSKKDGLLCGNVKGSGLDGELLKEMVQKIIEGQYPNVHSILIIKDGRLVFEEYFYEHHMEKLHELRSATKSFVSALTGIAIDKGMIKSQEAKVLDFFPEYNFTNTVNAKKQITIENLLTNQSGLDCDVSDPNSIGNESVMNNSSDWIKFTLDLPMLDSAGAKGRYCSGNPIVLGRIIEKVSKQKLPEFAKEVLFDPLNINKFVWNFKPDKSSVETFCQLYLTSRDMAKFGLLFLDHGQWQGKQIISDNWVRQSLTKHSVVQGVNYGYLWWNKYLEVGSKKFYAFGAQGNGGQKIYIWPEQNMVTVITGGNYNTQSPSDELIKRFILPPFKDK